MRGLQLATQMEVLDGSLTGRLQGKNCYGPEKVRRINEVVDKSDYDITFAYGDSRGDLEMLKMSDKPCYRRF